MKQVYWGAILTVFTSYLGCRSPENGAEKPLKRCPPRDEQPIRALLLGDRTGHPNDATFISVLRRAKWLAPNLIISVGDLIRGYQPDAELADAQAEWRQVLGMIRSVFGPDIPLFAAAGNHDVWSEGSAALFEKQIGHPVNFSFEMGAARVILFDTSRYYSETQIPEESLDWLVKELSRARDCASRIVVTHRPLWALNPGGEYGDPLHDVLIAGNANWVISGHWHHTMYDYRDGIRYLMVGPSGARPNRSDHPESGNFQQFGWLVVDNNGEIDISILDIGGVHRFDAFPYAFNQMEYQIEKRAVAIEGFELDPLNPRSAGQLRLTVTNVTNRQLTGALAFLDNGWRVSPASRKMDLTPNETQQLTFRYARKPGTPLFPGPTLTLPFNWIGKGEYHLRKSLAAALVRPIPRCAEAPVLDGRLDDACWRTASALGSFHELRGEAAPETDVRVALSETGIHISARIEDAEAAVKQRPPEPRDTYIESGDHFLVLVKSPKETDDYVRVAVNRDGTLFDRRHGTGASEFEEIAWNRAEARVQSDESGWQVEMTVPLDAPSEAVHGSWRIGFNFSLKKAQRRSFSIGWWQPLLEHDRDSFGYLELRQR
jgi:hypothetical protein